MTKQTRLVVHIDKDRCNGCGDCVPSCAEGAIQIIDGKARLVADRLCDGLGACLGHCPMDAIRLEERPADEFDHRAVQQHLASRGTSHACPGLQSIPTKPATCPSVRGASPACATTGGLGNWPIKLGLINPRAPYLNGADLLVAADCTAFADPSGYLQLQDGRVTVIGCPKLDDGGAYIDKIAQILRANDTKSITLAIMEVPCCSSMIRIVQMAQTQAGTDVPVKTEVVSIGG